MSAASSSEVSAPAFSVIVPVHNTRAYLASGVRSILRSGEPLEVVLVDDGSTDGSGALCDDLAHTDPRVRVVHQSNQGAATARNVGIRQARGDYLMFLDADDAWLPGDHLDRIQAVIRQSRPELIAHGWTDWWPATGVQTPRRPAARCADLTAADRPPIGAMFLGGAFPPAAWAVVVRRDFLVGRELYFPDGRRAEDIDWLLRVCGQASSVRMLDTSFYRYTRRRSGAMTMRGGMDLVRDLLWVVAKWYPEFGDPRQEWHRAARCYLARHFLSVFIAYRRVSPPERGLVRDDIEHAARGIDWARCGPMMRTFGMVLTRLGCDVASHLPYRYYRLRGRRG